VGASTPSTKPLNRVHPVTIDAQPKPRAPGNDVNAPPRKAGQSAAFMVLEVGGASQHRVTTVGLDLAVVFCVVVSPEQVFNRSNFSGLQ
jgi:hypothetical protein